MFSNHDFGEEYEIYPSNDNFMILGNSQLILYTGLKLINIPSNMFCIVQFTARLDQDIMCNLVILDDKFKDEITLTIWNNNEKPINLTQNGIIAIRLLFRYYRFC